MTEEEIIDGIARIIVDYEGTVLDGGKQILDFLKEQANYIRLADDQSLPELPAFYLPNECRATKDYVETLFNIGFKKVEL